MSILDNQTVIVFDIETTGLNLTLDTIIEFGAVKIKNNEIIEQKNLLFGGDFICSPFLVKNVHKIKDIDRKNKPLFKDCICEIYDYLNNNIVITHNGKHFDVPFLNEKMKPYGMQLNIRMIDTILLARKLNFKSNSLEFLSSYYKIDYGSHRGLGDAISTYQLVNKLAEDLNITNINQIII